VRARRCVPLGYTDPRAAISLLNRVGRVKPKPVTHRPAAAREPDSDESDPRRHPDKLMEPQQLNWIANFIWSIAADVLRDLYVRGKYRASSCR
jgi:hypothetical protein